MADLPLRCNDKNVIAAYMMEIVAKSHAQSGYRMELLRFVEASVNDATHGRIVQEWQNTIDHAEQLGLVRGGIENKKAEIIKRGATQTTNDAMRAVKLASVVIQHAVVDNAMWKFCRLAVVCNRDKAVLDIDDKKIDLRRIRSESTGDIIDHLLEVKFQKIERESIIEKWKCIVALLGYPDNLETQDYSYNQDRLAQFDSLRHNAVHGDGTMINECDVFEECAQLHRLPMAVADWISRSKKIEMLWDKYLEYIK